MAGGATQFDRDFRKWQAQLMKAVQPASFHQKVQEKHLPEIVNAIIGTVKVGIGPGNKPYPPYSESYKKQLGLAGHGGAMTSRMARRRALRSGGGRQAARRAGRKLWLVGGARPDMLDRKRFYWQIRLKSGKLFLCWAGLVYGPVHQGKEYGGTGHTKNPHFPARPFLHFESPAAGAAVNKMYRSTIEERTAQFNAGNLK